MGKLRKREDFAVEYDMVNDKLIVFDVKTKIRHAFSIDVLLDTFLNIKLKRIKYEE
jgi:hypothetical protein